MSSSIREETNLKRKRIMIIIDDENIIDQFETNSNTVLLKQNMFSFNSNPSEKIQSLPKTAKSNKCSLICVVCGASAYGLNFGAIVCESCKAFFRRQTRQTPINLHCRNNGNCQITAETRRFCVACRLARCFDNGMKRTRLSRNEEKTLKYRKIEENQRLALKLTSNKADEEFQSSPSTFFDDLCPSIDTSILQTDFTDLLLLPQPQQTLLTSEDFQRIETISFYYQKRIELANSDGLPWDPSTEVKTILQYFNSTSVSIMRFLAFVKQIPEFSQLNLDDKVILIKYNLRATLGITSVLHFHKETNQLFEHESDRPLNTQFFRPLHGYQTGMKIEKIFSSILSIANHDRKIIELIVIVLILTKGYTITSDPNEPTLKDTKSVYCAQNYYIELLWKYMETIHGYKTAFDLFSQLIIHIMSWQTIQEQIKNDVTRVLSPEDIDQLLPITKSFLHF